MNELQKLNEEYFKLLNRQRFTEAQLDYSILERHIPLLNHLADVSNSGITVFDSFRRKHVFTSSNYAGLFGYDLEKVDAEGNAYFDAKVHPEDIISILRTAVIALSHYLQLPVVVRKDYKLINEYRIFNNSGANIRVVEQHQVLELDPAGNIWLSLGVMDIAPNQDVSSKFSSQAINFKTGEIVIFNEPKATPQKQILSGRELSVLNLVKDGLLSKEISGRLSISVHTVNTHRQRILEKLNVSNTVEAINYARGLGLLS